MIIYCILNMDLLLFFEYLKFVLGFCVFLYGFVNFLEVLCNIGV